MQGNKQLSANEADGGCRFSCVRIHVERVISMVKQKYIYYSAIYCVFIYLISCDQNSVYLLQIK